MRAPIVTLSVALFFSFPTDGYGQEVIAKAKPQTGAPVQISQAICTESKPPSGAPIALGYSCSGKVQVVGAQDITAIGLVWRFKFADGKIVSSRSGQDTRLGTGNQTIRPGEIREMRSLPVGFRSLDGNTQNLIQAEVELEFVEDSTGSVWGDKKSPQYQHMVGARQGYNSAVARLRSIYAKQGISALLKELGVP